MDTEICGNLGQPNRNLKNYPLTAKSISIAIPNTAVSSTTSISRKTPTKATYQIKVLLMEYVHLLFASRVIVLQG